MVIALLYIILAYEKFHKNALLSDSGGNLYPQDNDFNDTGKLCIYKQSPFHDTHEALIHRSSLHFTLITICVISPYKGII